MRESARRDGESARRDGARDLILLSSRHHKHLHDHHIHTTGNAEHPTFTDAAGRTIAANQPHAPPR